MMRPAACLTRREMQVAGFVARGLSDKAIAKELDISTYTVRTHIAAAARKLDMPVRRRHALTVFFLSHDGDLRAG